MGKHGQYRPLVAAAALLAALGTATPGVAGCRLALALGMDVSRSVNAREYALQVGGLVAALQNDTIRTAFLQPQGDVMLAIYEWSGPDGQDIVIGWRTVASPADLDAIAAALATRTRAAGHQPTALGAALDFGRMLLDERADCAARTLDVSGDGRNNAGPTPARVYAARDFGDITVNGLPIASHEADIEAYYRSEVIRGDGAFVQPARWHEDFPAAILRKLERELLQEVVGDAGGPAGARG